MSNKEIEEEVPLHVVEDLITIRDTGKHNMMAMTDVVNDMLQRGDMPKSALWLVNYKGQEIPRVDSKRYINALLEIDTLLGLADQLADS